MSSVLAKSLEFLLQLLAASSVALLAYSTIIVIYRLTLHPLANYPGPFLAKITDLYQTYFAWKKVQHLKIKQLHDEYGPYVRYGPNVLLVNTNDGLKQIYGVKANVEKSPFYTASQIPGATHVQNTIDKSLHSRKRRVLAHAFSDQALRSMNKHILVHINKFCGLLPSPETPDEWSPPRDMARLFNYMTFDVICDLAFGKENMGQLDTTENRYVLDLYTNSSYRLSLLGEMRSWVKWGVDKVLFPSVIAGRARYQQFCKKLTLERIKMGNDKDRKDFFYHLINAKDPESGLGFKESELWAESILLVIAGSDTTAIALSSAFFYLTQTPRSLSKLEDEVLGTFENIDDIVPGPKLNSCTYLRACLDEAMRQAPSVPGHLPRRALNGGVLLKDHQIPAGVDLGTGIWSIHHNEEYYPDAASYIPERWIIGPEYSEEQVKLAQSAFNPFSLGSRGCLGKNLAYIEMLTTMARVVWLYEMRREPGSTVGADDSGKYLKQENVFTSRVDGPMVQFRVRKRS